MALNCASAAIVLWLARFKRGGSLVCRRTRPPITYGLHWLWTPLVVKRHEGFARTAGLLARDGGYWWLSWGFGGGSRWWLKRLRLRWAWTAEQPRFALHYEPITRMPHWTMAAWHKIVFGWLPGRWGGRWRRYDGTWLDDDATH